MKRCIYAPAKINFCLHVLGKRSDGYHDLAMLMQRVDLCDRIEIELSIGNGVTVRCPSLELPADGENIASRAARLLLKHVGTEAAVSISIDKKIPVAAGLGGGSSDAAAVLLALNEMLSTGLSRSELMDLGVRIGADVPFFIFGRTAWATGVGERLQPWPGLPPVWFVLVNPGIAVSTAWAFQNLGLTRSGATARIPEFPVGTNGLVRLLHNDLEAVTCQRYPVITSIKERLIADGACCALMSGSGATVFGVFPERHVAEQAARSYGGETGWWVRVASPL